MSEGTLLVIKPNRAGFFSNFNKVIDAHASEIGRNGVTGIYVDWSVPVPVPHFPYAEAKDGNLWEILFEPFATPVAKTDIKTQTDYSNLWITDIFAYGLYKLDRGWRDRLHQSFKATRVRSHLLSRVDALVPSRPATYRVAVHYRHAGHNRECPFPIASVDYFIERVRSLVRRKEDWQVVLATDVEDTYRVFKKAFGTRLVAQDNITRNTDHLQFHDAGRVVGVRLAEEVLIDALMLSRCNAMLHVTSNIATAVGYMNPSLKMIYCEPLWQKVLGLPKLWTSRRFRKLVMRQWRTARARPK